MLLFRNILHYILIFHDALKLFHICHFNYHYYSLWIICILEGFKA